MTTPAKWYTRAIIAMGICGTFYAARDFFSSMPQVGLYAWFESTLCLVILCVICRSLPIYINRTYALDVSILSIVAAVLARGACTATMVYLVSSLFTVDMSGPSGSRHHILNTPPLKTAFNNATMVLAILVPGLIIEWMGFVPGKLTLPGVLGPMFVFTALTFLLNYAIMFSLFLTTKQAKPDNALRGLVGLLPNVLAAMPLGLFTGLLFTSEYGHWMAVVMLLPLLLARYAWKLYLESQQQYFRLIHAFVSTMEAKDTYTEGHSRRVNQYAMLIAQNMRLKQSEVNTIRSAALLHDIGKIGIADAILFKPERLTDEEYAHIKCHPEIGVGIVERVGLPLEVVEIIRHHHERYDGQGYPDGLDHTKLSLGAQILTVADSYDAMTSERPYRKGLPRDVAVSELIAGKWTQFNPEIVDTLIRALDALGEDGELPDGELP